MFTNQLVVNTVGLPAGTANYYLSIAALTPNDGTVKAGNTATRAENNTPNVSPFVMWAPFGIFFVLFISAFGIMIANKVWNWKRAASALVLSLCLASIPIITISMQNGGISTQSHAGPEEVPRQVMVSKLSFDSVTVSWSTDKESVGAVRYSIAPFNATSAKIIFADNGKSTGKHSVTITGLKVRGVYEMEIYSNAKWFSDSGKPLKFTVASK
jgi:hypothetical protein